MELKQIIHFFEQFCGISFVLYVIVFLAWLSLRKIDREHNKVYLSKYIDVLEEILEAIMKPMKAITTLWVIVAFGMLIYQLI
ncbi:hypothetical protein [Anaerostipes hadrus]|uniref:hypothetical protein n=1 Tax=Anaerostipes hadrus TaxID=649756 RepID=UPI00156F2243|nr:hypothetical protein [Anaerostipes hadrus]MCG4624967.1 hypothetical protein [Anaerostipes hadrus]NSG72394.1 hypothetical protein [Anaerostipes hadrus]